MKLRNSCIVANKTYRGVPGHRQWMHCRLEERTFNRRRNTNRVRLLTVHDHPHTLDKTVDNLERLKCSCPSFVMRQSVQPLQDSLDILLSEIFLYKFDCVGLGKVIRQRELERSLDRPCLISFVASANVVSTSIIILTTISSIAGVGVIRVYISRQLRKCSIDSSKSTRAS
jgi:hypothetical protein